MDYLFSRFSKIKELLENKFILLLLDYDGTLTPIAETPGKAIIRKDTKELLQKLSKSNLCKIGIISGRKLEEIKNIVGIDGIIYAGNHGFQIEGPKIKHEMAVSLGYKKILERIKIQLQEKLSGIKGVFVEDKKLSLALHFRLADPQQISLIKTAFHESVILYLVRNKIKIRPGKKILEVIPPVHWDKGRIVLWLLARQDALSKDGKIVPIYIGDDTTDEDAFKVLKNRGLTIFVGRTGSSQAKYYVKDVKEVQAFLKRVLSIQGKNKYARISQS
jgi:trehalose-phosphatase